MSEGRAFITLLQKLEETLQPPTFALEEFNYWPIVRFAINYRRKHGRSRVARKPVSAPPVAANFLGRLKAVLGHETGRQRGLDFADHLPTAEILFLPRQNQLTRTGTGHVTHLFLDGIRSVALPHGGDLSLVDRNPLKEGESFLYPTKLLPSFRMTNCRSLLDPQTSRDANQRGRIVEKVRIVNSALADISSDLRIEEDDILSQIDFAIERGSFYFELFKHIRPKLIILTSYTGAYYVCPPARRLGIPVVDVQHGGMHRHHYLASHWSHIPTNGYELLPDFFWCWSEKSESYINFGHCEAHRTIVGGNPKVALERMLYPTSSLPPRDTFPAERPRVLVALQYAKGEVIAKHVADCFNETRNEVDWLFRLHPMGRDKLDEIVSQIDVTAEEVLKVSNAPLHQLLPTVDLVLTKASTIVNEAIDYGTSAAVWSEDGVQIFDDRVGAGEVIAALTSIDLRSAIFTARARGIGAHSALQDQCSVVRNAVSTLLATPPPARSSRL